MSLWIMWQRHRARVLSKYEACTVVAYVGSARVGAFLAGKEVT